MADHPYKTYQQWKNKDFTIYVLSVNDDVFDERGNLKEAGRVCLTTEKPFPGRQAYEKGDAPDLKIETLDEVISKGNYVLQEDTWDTGFMAAAAAQAAVRQASGDEPNTDPELPPLSGLGALAKR